jgi:hypothetical protein
MSSALTFLANALSRSVSSLVHSRVIFHSPTKLDTASPARPLLLNDKLGAFFERRLHYSLKLGIAQEFFGHTEFRVELPFRPRQWLWHIPLIDDVPTRSVRWPRDLHSTYRLSRAICTTFPFSARARPGAGWLQRLAGLPDRPTRRPHGP